jgi:tripartite-type tricarboxylate transporter receptor subunit TctC
MNAKFTTSMAAAFAAMLASATLAQTDARPDVSQSYPLKPLRMIVGFAPGGTNDILARVIAPRMATSLGQPVVVENRPGATGVIASEVVAKAAPDGLTLLLGSTGSQSIVQWLRPMPYDPVKDLLPVSLVGVAGTVLAVRADLPAHSVRELVALARANPGKLSYASSGNGSTQHLGGALFNLVARVDMLHVPYKGNAPALADVISGQVDMMFSAAPPALPLAKAGKLRLLGVSTTGRLAGLEDIPTIAESGVPGYEMSTWYGVFTSGGTPAATATRLAAEVKKAIEIPQVRALILAQGVEPAANTPEEYRSFVNDEMAKWAKVVKAANIRAD